MVDSPSSSSPRSIDDQRRRQLRDRGDRALLVGVARVELVPGLVDDQRAQRLDVGQAALDGGDVALEEFVLLRGGAPVGPDMRVRLRSGRFPFVRGRVSRLRSAPEPSRARAQPPRRGPNRRDVFAPPKRYGIQSRRASKAVRGDSRQMQQMQVEQVRRSRPTQCVADCRPAPASCHTRATRPPGPGRARGRASQVVPSTIAPETSLLPSRSSVPAARNATRD